MSDKTSAELYELQGGCCFYCNVKMRAYPWRATTPQQLRGYTRDHVVPQALGGNVHHNIVLACRDCNNEKGDRKPTKIERELCRLLYFGHSLIAARAHCAENLPPDNAPIP